MHQADTGRDARADKRLIFAAIAVYMVLVARVAWVSEDAYITLRTVDNFLNDYGLRWNVNERVQGFTHPMWMFVLMVSYALTGEEFYSTIVVSLLTSLACVMLLSFSVARSLGHALCAMVLLMTSRAFTDFSTGGLENPLSHLLFVGFVWLYAVRRTGLFSLTFAASLIAVNRSDLVLITLPAMIDSALSSIREHGFGRTLRAVLLGASPLLAWEVFSVFYYGFPFPNTAYAKLATRIPQDEVNKQGAMYVLAALEWDPALLGGIFAGLGLALMSKRRTETLLGIGVLLYVVYIVRIGGDFMLGRFFTAPLLVAACLVAISELPMDRPAYAFGFAVPIVALALMPSLVQSWPDAGQRRLSSIHVADERGVYRDGNSLVAAVRTQELPRHPWVDEGRRLRAEKAKVKVTGNIGLMGFFAGPDVYIIDYHALTDPLLARLPVRRDINWRVGHLIREIPRGYEDTVRSPDCRMEDRKLCAFYEKLRIITRGPLFSWQRWVAIFKMNLRMYDDLIDVDRYQLPELKKVPALELSEKVPDGTSWDNTETHVMTESGIDVMLKKVSHADTISISLDSADDYRVEFHRKDQVVGSLEIKAMPLPGLRTSERDIPDNAIRKGFDRVRILPTRGDGRYAVGHVILTP